MKVVLSPPDDSFEDMCRKLGRTPHVIKLATLRSDLEDGLRELYETLCTLHLKAYQDSKHFAAHVTFTAEMSKERETGTFVGPLSRCLTLLLTVK